MNRRGPGFGLHPGHRLAAALGVAAAAAVLTSCPPRAGANPVDMFGFGGRAPALGGAQTAAANDGSANYYNPALLATYDDIRIDVGYQIALPTLELNGLDLNVDDSRGIAVALTSPGRLGPLRIAASVALYLPDHQVLRIRALDADQPRFALFDNRPQRLFLGANLAVQLGPHLAIGGGLAYMAKTVAAVDLSGRLGFPDASDSDLALAIDADVKPIQYPQAGLLWHAAPWLDVGLSYRGGYTLVLDNTIRILADIGRADMPIVRDASLQIHALAQDLFQPQQVSAGLAARLTHRLLLAFDLAFHRWSTFENPATRLKVAIDAGQFNDLLPPIKTSRRVAPYYHDIAVPRLGLEYRAWRGPRDDIDLRAGYVYEPSPVPDQIGTTNFVDCDKHTVSAGVGFTIRHPGTILPRPLRLDTFAALTVLAARDTHKLSPVDPVGDYRATGRVIQLGLSSTWRF